jgi:maltokinase-like protein
MALLHDATLTPSKRDLMTAWLATRAWAEGFEPVRTIASYRFDDPAGQVGLEAALLADPDGVLVHVPLSYRGAPLDGAEEFLVGTADHSVLGPRWIYDACGDPAWCTELATAIAEAGEGVEQYFEVDGRREIVPPRMTVRGSGGLHGLGQPERSVTEVRDEGATTVTRYGDLELVVVRRVGTPIEAEATLAGRWSDGSGVLAGLRRV